MLEPLKRISSTVETAPDKRPVEINEHLQRCLVDIDLNMVRARVVTHPSNWTQSGYRRDSETTAALWDDRSTGVSFLCGFAGVTDFNKRRNNLSGIDSET